MKKASLFFGLLMCGLLLVSCHKEDGPNNQPVVPGVNDKFLTCDIVANVDYAKYKVDLNFEYLEDTNSFWLEKLEFAYWRKGDSVTDITTILIKEKSVLTSAVAHWQDSLPNLQPNSVYGYRLMLTDGFIVNDTLTDEFRTYDPTPTVKIDSVIETSGNAVCYATVGAYARAMMENTDCEFNLFWGEDSLSITTPVEPIQTTVEEITEDSLSYHFSGSIIMSSNLNIWFKAFARNSWGNEVYSDAVNLARNPISLVMSEADTSQWASDGIVKLFGNARTGADENAVLYRCGFCYGLSPNVTIESQTIIANTTSWGLYSCELSGLEPNKTYYYRSFLQLDNEEGPVYYSSSIYRFTTGDAIVPEDPVKVVVGVQLENPLLPAGLYVITASVEGDESLVTERGYVWKAKTGGMDGSSVDFDNADGYAVGYTKADIPSEYSAYLFLAGLNLADNDFVTIASGLEGETIYVFRAYIKWGENISYSDTTIEIKTPG